jgi:excisionase family DNA binding protein
MDDLLKPTQISQMLSVPVSTIYYWIHIQFIPYIKIGRYVRFHQASIIKWLSEREVKPRNIKKISSDIIRHRIGKKACQSQLRGGQELNVSKS